MRPAAASETSRHTPRPERTPPLAYISITIASTSDEHARGHLDHEARLAQLRRHQQHDRAHA
jgi:hypothetical protein